MRALFQFPDLVGLPLDQLGCVEDQLAIRWIEFQGQIEELLRKVPVLIGGVSCAGR